MAMPVPPAPITTIDELLALPEDRLRHELLDGAHVVTPAPALPHQALVKALALAIDRALTGRPDLQLLWSPADVVLGARTLVQPDLFVVRKAPGQVLRSWKEAGIPVLAIEVLSPATAARDRGAKRRSYQQAGVAEYWIVDPDARLLERWRPEDTRPEVVSGDLVWDAAPVTITLPDLFASVLGLV